MKKESKLYSVIHQKCPRCHEGDMFKHGPYSLKFTEMNSSCPVCEQDFIQEPSFYWGAMYFSYAIQVIVFVAVYFALRYTVDPGAWIYVIAMVAGSIAIVPFNFQFSRVAWINLFVSYRKRTEA